MRYLSSTLAAGERCSQSTMASPATLMAAECAPDVLDGFVCLERDHSFPPINFVYRHLHDALRRELKRLAELVHRIEQRIVSESVVSDLSELYDQYHLLVQVNRCHSSVEDEVRYRQPGQPSFRLFPTKCLLSMWMFAHHKCFFFLRTAAG